MNEVERFDKFVKGRLTSILMGELSYYNNVEISNLLKSIDRFLNTIPVDNNNIYLPDFDEALKELKTNIKTLIDYRTLNIEPTIGLIGEGQGASRGNPEVFPPFDNLRMKNNNKND